MPRPLVYANGTMLVGVDPRGTVRDLFYPQIGLYNHLSGHWIRMGVWHNGKLSWCDDQDWQVDQQYLEDTLIGRTTLSQPDFEIQFDEYVDPEENVFFRRIRIPRAPGDFKLFFTHDLRIAESDIGDCAFYKPGENCLIHYKGNHCFAFGIVGRPLEGYACGVKGFGGMEGTWRDAEDGELSMKAIEQGSVDSTFFVSARPGETLPYYIACAGSVAEVAAAVPNLDPEASWTREETRGEAISARVAARLAGLPPDIQAFAMRSALILLTQIDAEGGILAATDSDIMKTARANYCYIWPRDGALVAEVLDTLGLHAESRCYFTWLTGINRSLYPPFLQRYRPDQTLGASWHPWIVNGNPEIPFQEDESALTVLALAKHLLDAPTLENEEGFRHEATDLIRQLTSFMGLHIDEYELPLPSYDLWEERRGIHAFTVAAVIQALEILVGPPAELQTLAAEMRASFRHTFVDEDRGVLVRTVHPVREGYEQDQTVDASLIPALLSGIFEIDDPVVTNTMRLIEEKLWIQSDIGGLARYEGDYYFRQSNSHPGNPWIITTMWLAQYKIQIGDLARADDLLRWAMHHAAPTGVLPEQLHPDTGAHLSVSPLTWSHAEFLRTSLMLSESL